MKKQKLMILCCLAALMLGACGNGETGTKETEGESAAVTADAGEQAVEAAQAAFIRLTKTQGQVGVTDQEKKSVEAMENLQIYDGYQVETEKTSYAWMNLDDTKLAKMDEASQVKTSVEGKKMVLWLNSGSLFFNVTKPLEEDETFEIGLSSMITGIRGTAGWVEMVDEEHMKVYVLEGTVNCMVGDSENAIEVSVSAGEMAELVGTPGEEEIRKGTFSYEDIPQFVLDEIESDAELKAKIDKTKFISINMDFVNQLAERCEAGDLEGAFALMATDDFTELAGIAEENGQQIFPRENGKGLGIYPTEENFYGSCMVYYGGYEGENRQGEGLWLGEREAFRYQASGSWSGDKPNGAQEAYWRNDKTSVSQKFAGTTVDGLWDGKVAIHLSDQSGDTPEAFQELDFEAQCETGKWVLVDIEKMGFEQVDDEYIIAVILDNTGIHASFGVESPDEIGGIRGFD